MTDADLAEYFTAVLEKIGRTPSVWRLQWFREWARYENTGARFNPLATTQPGGEFSADPYWNSFGSENQYHVRNYATFDDGVLATAHTLVNGYYPAVLAMLDNEGSNDLASVSAQLRTWGTTGFANEVAEGWLPAGAAAVPPVAPDAPEPTLQSLLAYCDALNAAVLTLERKLHDAYGLLVEGALQAQAAVAPGG